MLTDWLTTFIEAVSKQMPDGWWLSTPPQISALMAILLLSLVCGAVGSLVVGNRMAFLSDALAHCAFAGVTLGVLFSIAAQMVAQQHWIIPVAMVGFGVVVGVAIAFVRENTNLASDTIIGVFFALAVASGVMLMGALRRGGSYFSPESFLFGSILATEARDIVVLAGLLAATAVAVCFTYNAALFASFNGSLARSRGVPVRLCNYLVIILLALIVNLCIKIVGALLINALLVVPAAAAANVARGSRGMFWWTVAITAASGVGGLYISDNVELPIGGRDTPLPLQPSGAIVLLCVAAFFISMTLRMIRERRRPALSD